MKHILALTSFIIAAACAATPKPEVVAAKPGPDPVQLAKAIARAGEQVAPCYRAPRLNRNARQIVTVLHVYYTADGMLAAEPVLIRQSGITEENRVYAATMLHAATDAVARCVPMRLPPELYKNGWDEFDLTFSPRGMA